MHPLSEAWRLEAALTHTCGKWEAYQGNIAPGERRQGTKSADEDKKWPLFPDHSEKWTVSIEDLNSNRDGSYNNNNTEKREVQ